MPIAIERLKQLTGFSEPALRLDERQVEDRGDHRLERLSLRLGDGTPVRAFLTRPKEVMGRLPAILYAHAHGGRYEIGASELIDGRPALLDPPAGALFARAGYVTLCLDMPTFGDRSNVKESAASKAALWHGRTLFGQMLGEQAAALTWLATRDDVDPARIGMTGISMGATLAYFLAAMEPRIRAVAHLCCYADFAALIESGAHDLHGHYLTMPGLLAETSTGEIAGLVAPRSQLICVGTDDPLTPPEAVAQALVETKAAYAESGAVEALVVLEEQGVAHQESPRMRAAVLEFFRDKLG